MKQPSEIQFDKTLDSKNRLVLSKAEKSSLDSIKVGFACTKHNTSESTYNLDIMLDSECKILASTYNLIGLQSSECKSRKTIIFDELDSILPHTFVSYKITTLLNLLINYGGGHNHSSTTNKSNHSLVSYNKRKSERKSNLESKMDSKLKSKLDSKNTDCHNFASIKSLNIKILVCHTLSKNKANNEKILESNKCHFKHSKKSHNNSKKDSLISRFQNNKILDSTYNLIGLQCSECKSRKTIIFDELTSIYNLGGLGCKILESKSIIYMKAQLKSLKGVC